MKEFVTAALPWILMGLALAVWAAAAVKKKRRNKANTTATASASGWQKNKFGYMTEGMCLGICAGVAA